MACKLNQFTLVSLLKLWNRFRWVFCQLECLRHCLPPSVRHTLDELPETLDETYERVLKEIKKPNRDHARRLLQCLVVAIRPLRVEELAEVLAVDFDDAEEIPKLNPNWRWEDEEQALLTSCSSLIVILETCNSLIFRSKNSWPRHDSLIQVMMSLVIISTSSLRIRYWRKLAWAFCSSQTFMLKRTALGGALPWLGMLLNIGPRMRNSRACHHSYKRQWNISLIWKSRILQLGLNYAT